MLRKIMLFLCLVGLSSLSYAGADVDAGMDAMGMETSGEAVEVKADHPDSYEVQKGDTLWGISEKFLPQPWLWPEVWQANPQIENPHLIYPGDIVSLHYRDGKPILTVTRRTTDTSGRYVRLSPTIHSYEKEQAIPTIPIDSIKQFLVRPLVVTDEEMKDWPYVVSSYDEHLIAGAGNKIYARGNLEDKKGQRYAIYRKGKPYINSSKDKDAILGYEALYIADAVMEMPGDPASLHIPRSNREILAGDRLAVEPEEDVSANFLPKPPAQEVSGNVISVIDGMTQIGQYQVVVLDMGSATGIEVGNVLGVYQSGKKVKDYIATTGKKKEDRERLKLKYEDSSMVDKGVSNFVNDVRDTKQAFDDTALVGYLGRPGVKPVEVELPAEYAGVLMVFRTFENISYALVMETVSAIHVNDTVKNL